MRREVGCRSSLSNNFFRQTSTSKPQSGKDRKQILNSLLENVRICLGKPKPVDYEEWLQKSIRSHLRQEKKELMLKPKAKKKSRSKPIWLTSVPRKSFNLKINPHKHPRSKENNHHNSQRNSVEESTDFSPFMKELHESKPMEVQNTLARDSSHPSIFNRQRTGSLNNEELEFDEKVALEKIHKALFYKGPVDLELINDNSLFKVFQAGLTPQEKEWIEQKRDQILIKHDQAMLKRQMSKKMSMKGSRMSSPGNMNEVGSKQSIQTLYEAFTSKFKPQPSIFENKVERYAMTGKGRDERIRIVQKMKEKILNSKRREIKTKIANREQRVQIFSSQNMTDISNYWFELHSLNFICQAITQKFLLRKQTRDKVMKLGRRVCWIVKSVGMFLILLRRARIRISTIKLTFFAQKYCKRWVDRQKRKKAKILYEFLKFTNENRAKVDLKCLKFYKVICKVQKRVKQFIARRRLRYAILNNRWNVIEKRYFRKNIKDSVDSEGNHKNIVPYKLRKLYFVEYLRYFRIVYIKDFKKWEERCEQIKKDHIKMLADINAFSALTEQPLIRKDPEFPEKPCERTLISMQQMREVVREITCIKDKWKGILNGSYSPPILSSIRKVKL